MSLKSIGSLSQEAEIKLLLEAIFLKYGYDFRNYAEASINRRILRNMAFAGYRCIAELHRHVLNDKACFDKLLLDLSISVSEMFRDPRFFKNFRNHVIPGLRQLPSIKIWHAGCASGEEVYSMAILFLEEGLDRKTRVYATDFNEKILIAAGEGKYPIGKMKDYALNYELAGGKSSFEKYYTARQHHAVLHTSLKHNIEFSHHNLVSDSPIGEMDVILCRNVLIYFNRHLQSRVLHLFNDSLSDTGYLCLGTGESLRYSTCSDHFEDIVPKEKIYRKRKEWPV